ncbi:MAG: SO_0444 family Cu/Zn efflux transporter [Planctomycetes bacterium]|nr:SO_0444 family Cu/Zn efflux transporter [Planctomycetota bacterium]
MEVAPWLIFGLLLAGGLHVLLPEGFISRHLGGSRLGNVFKAVAVGVPMPLCSCGVIPAAIALKKEGASDGASMGFLISTPQTGVDSILVSAAFLGWPFAFFKVISALVSGLVGGLLVNLLKRPNSPENAPASSGHCCANGVEEKKGTRGWKDIFIFGFSQLLRDIYRWLIVGILAAALISTFLPDEALSQYWWSQGVAGLFAILIISLPMYICATASVPLAASLVLAGMSPGAALVLLMAGPVTNVATIGTVYRTFGIKVVGVYLGTVIVMSLVMGFAFDQLLTTGIPQASEHLHSLPAWFQSSAAVILIGFIIFFVVSDLWKKLRPTKAAHKPVTTTGS